ncbi:MAG: OmpW/AlkL family protein [Pseudomonadota bacterium]|jgi:outer membrane protein
MTTKLAVAALAAGLVAAGAAQAQDFKPKAQGDFILHLRITDVAPVGTDPITTLAGAPTGLRADVDYAVVPSVGLTYFFTDNIAAEVIATTTKHTVKAKGAGVDLKLQETWVLPPVVSLQYHFAPKAKVSPYVGVGVNYMLFYSEEDHNGFALKVKDGFGYALQGGVDVALRDQWALNLDVKKVFFDTTATDRFNGVKSKVNLDPWVVSAGFGYRF